MENKRYLETLKTCGVLGDISDKALKAICESKYSIGEMVKVIGSDKIESIGMLLSIIDARDQEKVMNEIKNTCEFIIKYTKDDKIKNIISYLYLLHAGDFDKEKRKLTYKDLRESIKELKISDIVTSVTDIWLYNKWEKLYLKGSKGYKYLKTDTIDGIKAIIYSGDNTRIVSMNDDYKAIIQDYKERDNFDIMIVPYVYEDKFGGGV